MTGWKRRLKVIVDEVSAAGGALMTTSGWMRDLYGAGRNGHLVRADIEGFLAEHKIRHLPTSLPADQRHPVLLYSAATAAGQAIAAGLRLAELEARHARPEWTAS